MIIILILIYIEIEISVVLTAMRTKERKEYNTDKELKKEGYEITKIKIEKIEGSNFKNAVEWKNRVTGIEKLIQENL